MKKHLPFIVLLFALTGCSIYHPQAVDIPLVNHRGDTQVDISAGISTWVLPDVLTINATGSYGFTDWMAGQVHLNYGIENAYGHMAAGAYRTLGAHGVVEGYLGLGLGGAWREKVEVKDDDAEGSQHGVHTYDYSGRFTLPFVQGNIGWRDLTAAHIDLAFGLKVGAYLPDFDYKAYNSNGQPMASQSKPYKEPNFLIEPQLQFRIGGEHLKWNLRMGFSWLSDVYNNSETSLTYDWLTLSTGLTFFF